MATGQSYPRSHSSSNGIGFHTAYQLASHGAKVYIGARSDEKAEAAIRQMRTSNPAISADKLHPFIADLGDLRAVTSAAQNLLTYESRLDILVHNAAILSMPVVLDSYGISVAFATNHFGPFALTKALLPLLKKTAETSPGVRVVTVSAPAYKLLPPGIRFDSVTSFNIELEPTQIGDAAFTRYGLSKLANLLFARQLQKNFDEEGIKALSVSLHPGLIKTDGTIKMVRPENQQAFAQRMSPPDGALNTLFAATNPEVWEKKEKFGGAYLVPHGKIEEPIGNGANDKLATELWATSEEVLHDILT
ncbi:hypothetical protein BP6252_00027 [Coleophoma cylindrospora]|uniref:Uncharacterized protein n=1 Tax=Coleophoma cylindrospora TaxID=1849047 RepID=A0A3D8SNU9_9HELO|nr:hypothetical protein BP6252_00027 [Coleophoma cylindrospora]